MSDALSARSIDSDATATENTTRGPVESVAEGVAESVLPAEQSASLAPITAGCRLRGAREAAGLSVADVAEVLRFSAHQIDALERDDHAHLAGSTLVRGMIRGYAKLLKIKSEPLLVGLGGDTPAPAAEVRAPTNIGLANKATTVARVSRGALVVLAIVVLLFFIVAGYVYLMSDVPSDHIASTSTEALVAAPAQVVANVQIPVVTPDSSVTASSPASMVATTSSPPANALIIDFDDLSWIEITDASQSIVFRGEQPKGTHQVVEGKPPFQLWIGRASAVRVSFGDRVIDLKPHSRENIARLTVE